MTSISNIFKKHAILLSGVALIAIWGGTIAFQEFAFASAQQALAVQASAMPVASGQ